MNFYDSHAAELSTHAGDDHSALLDAISRDLASCDCSGTFHYAAARRCFSCKSVVVTDAGVDLFLFTGCELNSDDPTDAQQEMYDEYESKFVLKAAICR